MIKKSGKIYSYKKGYVFDGDDKALHRIGEIIYTRSEEEKHTGFMVVQKPFKIRIIVEEGE